MKSTDYGTIHISKNAIATIAGKAIDNISGVADINRGFTGKVSKAFGQENAGKGINVEMNEDIVVIDIAFIVEYGKVIPDVAYSVQEKTKKTVESLTGLNVQAVNIYVQGIRFPSSEKLFA
jgi:uncharacterized alkaline shock family protein YloU